MSDLSEQLVDGDGPMLGARTPFHAPDGWVEDERVAAGVASRYRAAVEEPATGRLDLVEDGVAEYRTRVLVRRPATAATFNGTVVVEWLNVSGGVDAAPDFTCLADELVRAGYAWVGVSAQHIGVEGGEVVVRASVPGAENVAGVGLRRWDPARYDSLRHPGDAFSYDIVSQVGRALRAGAGLGGLHVERLLIAGSSQSALMLTTYVNGVQPSARAYDGFLLHSRAGADAPLGQPDAAIDLVDSLIRPAALIRSDLDVPVLVLQTETDLTFLGSRNARQPDTDVLRLWEVAGTAHADRFLAAGVVETLGADAAVNDGPLHFVAKAALLALDRWVGTGKAPSEAARLELDKRDLRRDADGIAIGGVRTPPVDVPVDVLSGRPIRTDNVLFLLLGSTSPLPQERLVELYGTRANYLAAYAEATDAAIERGFLLAEDRPAVMEAAQPERVPDA